MGYIFRRGEKENDATAFVLLTNPADREKKLLVFEAHLQRLHKDRNKPVWYLTGLISHGLVGGQRLGWDNLMVPLSEAHSKP